MKSITRYFLIVLAVIIIGIVTKPSESKHRARLTSEIVRHNIGGYAKELRHHKETGSELTKSEYVNYIFDVTIDDYVILSLGKMKSKTTGVERTVSIAALGQVFMK